MRSPTATRSAPCNSPTRRGRPPHRAWCRTGCGRKRSHDAGTPRPTPTRPGSHLSPPPTRQCCGWPQQAKHCSGAAPNCSRCLVRRPRPPGADCSTAARWPATTGGCTWWIRSSPTGSVAASRSERRQGISLRTLDDRTCVRYAVHMEATIEIPERPGQLDMAALDGRLNTIAGHLNTQHGLLVDCVIELLTDEASWAGPGIHTPEQYLTWRMGLSPARAQI